jgi:hypothetical protein
MQMASSISLPPLRDTVATLIPHNYSGAGEERWFLMDVISSDRMTKFAVDAWETACI